VILGRARTLQRLLPVVSLLLGWPSAALAITVKVTKPPPTLVGGSATYEATVTDAVGEVSYRWTIQSFRGEELNTAAQAQAMNGTDFLPGLSKLDHTFAQPGNYSIQVRVQDQTGGFGAGDIAYHAVHWPLTPTAPTASTSIVYDEARKRVYNVNPDSDTITAVDASKDPPVKLSELSVYGRPEALAMAPDGRLWVLHRDDYAIAIVNLDKFEIEKGFRLPYASQPIGLAMSPAKDAAYVTLQATGLLLKLDPRTGEILGQLAVGSSARGVSVSHDGKAIYVTRFISADSHGEVVLVDGPSFQVTKRIQLLPDVDPCLEGDQFGRGLPNYLFSIALSPDGRRAWFAGKKDNILRGPTRDGLNLNSDNTVRPMLGVIDVTSNEEDPSSRMDLDDRNLPTQVVFSPLGNYAFIPLTGNDKVAVRDTYVSGETAIGQPATLVTEISDTGRAPRGLVLAGERLFVHGFLSRSIVVLDVSGILSGGADSVKIADIPAVAQEKLAPDVLRGKQTFYNSEDRRMSDAGYLSCATCHFDGFEDGRTWDFTRRGNGLEPMVAGGPVKPIVRKCAGDPPPGGGVDPPLPGQSDVSLREGLRNTTSLLGRRGMGQGLVHWSGNFDEIQDFECEIRLHFGGSGFISRETLPDDKCRDPLGAPKAGMSPELDDLAAYVTSLEHVDRSPYRNQDGTLTADGEAGKALFTKLGCDFCHVGPDFTDSSRKMLHDVGTLKPTSGYRSGAPLTGIDTPTLLGVWETAPYLHDGSAPTLRDVVTTANPHDDHGFVKALNEQQVDQLVSYLQQIDNDLPVKPLPFEPPAPDASTPVPHTDPTPEPTPQSPKCLCQLPGGGHSPAWSTGSLLVPLALWYRRRKRGGAKGAS
jgi:DNA-binding beta-propeller fold protein YncE